METESNEIKVSEREKTQIILGIDSLIDLNEIGKWAKFMAILGFIGTGVVVLFGLVFMGISSMADEFTQLPFPIWIIGFVYVGVGAILYFPSMFMYSFSTHIHIAVHNHDNVAAGIAFDSLKKYFRFIGIALIVSIVLEMLLIGGALFLSVRPGLLSF